MRLPTLILIVALISACRLPAHLVDTVASPKPAPTPRISVTLAVLRPSEVPADLSACLMSGPLATYASRIASDNPALAGRITTEWANLRRGGARSAAISLFAASSASCTLELAAAPGSRSVASLVVDFDDTGAAERAWLAGILGLVPPPIGEVAPGVAQGDATGLGTDSWTYVRGQERVASWHRKTFAAIVAVTGGDESLLRATSEAVDVRLQ